MPSSGQGRLCFSVMVSSSLQFRLVVKTALKLLLVFVEYSESNAPLLIQAVSAVDTKRGEQPHRGSSRSQCCIQGGFPSSSELLGAFCV